MNRVIFKQNKRKMALDAFICDGVRTPIGKFGGALSSVRADDLAALPITELLARHPQVDWSQTDEVIYGDANQAGEDNRNVARMAALLAGLPQDVPGITVNRLCASGMDAVGFAARGIKSGDYELVIAGGVESMSRAPFVMAVPVYDDPRAPAVDPNYVPDAKLAKAFLSVVSRGEAGHVFLFGPAGTGKSSILKSVLQGVYFTGASMSSILIIIYIHSPHALHSICAVFKRTVCS